MNIKYLAVDSDIELAESEAVGWAKRGIIMDRVDTMSEAIKRIVLMNEYLYVGINSNVVNFMPLLETMRSVTKTPILIATSNFTTDKEIAALRKGADLYARFHTDTEGNIRNEDNIESVLAWVDSVNKRVSTSNEVLFHGDILLSYDFRAVFINDTEIDLTKKEFGLIYHFMNKRGRVLSFKELYTTVWGDSYEENISCDSIKSAIKRLRKKLGKDENDNSIIENVHGVGYKMPVLS